MLWGLWLRLKGTGGGTHEGGLLLLEDSEWKVRLGQPMLKCRATVENNVLAGRPALEGEISKPYRSNQVSNHFQIINYCLCIPHVHTPPMYTPPQSAFIIWSIPCSDPHFFSALLVSLNFCLSRKQDLNNSIHLQHRKISDYVWLLQECYEIFLFHEIL